MIHGIVMIKKAAHRAAQKSAKDSLREIFHLGPFNRQRVLDYLEMAGFPRFLLGGDDQGPLVPLAEYRAWAKTFEEDDLTDGKEDTDVCPNCGTLGYSSSRDQGHHCPKCGDIYWTRGDRIEELASQLLGGACKAYSGPGRAFSDSPWARVTRTRILVKQRGGFDV